MEYSPDFDIILQVYADHVHTFNRRSVPNASGEDSSTSDRDTTDDNATGTDVNNTADKPKELTLSGKCLSSYHILWFEVGSNTLLRFT